MRFAERLCLVTSGKSGLLSSRPVGNSGKAMRGVRTRCGATCDTNIVSCERQRIAQNSASFASERVCAEGRGIGVQPVSSFSVK